MSAPTRPWIGWIADYADEGAVWVDAEDLERALEQVAFHFGEPLENVEVRKATADDGDKLQEMLASAHEQLTKTRKDGAR